MIVDFLTKPSQIQPLSINGEIIERVSNFKFLGTVISDNLRVYAGQNPPIFGQFDHFAIFEKYIKFPFE